MEKIKILVWSISFAVAQLVAAVMSSVNEDEGWFIFFTKNISQWQLFTKGKQFIWQLHLRIQWNYDTKMIQLREVKMFSV